jgi:hypothetical protein
MDVICSMGLTKEEEQYHLAAVDNKTQEKKNGYPE